jgi:hypothetical protein
VIFLFSVDHGILILFCLFCLRIVSSPRTTVRLYSIVPLNCVLKMKMEYLFFSIFRRFFQVSLALSLISNLSQYMGIPEKEKEVQTIVSNSNINECERG